MTETLVRIEKCVPKIVLEKWTTTTGQMTNELASKIGGSSLQSKLNAHLSHLHECATESPKNCRCPCCFTLTLLTSLSLNALHHFSRFFSLSSFFSPSLLVALPSSAVLLPAPCARGISDLLSRASGVPASFALSGPAPGGSTSRRPLGFGL